MSADMPEEETIAVIAKYFAKGYNSWLKAPQVGGIKAIAVWEDELKAVKELKDCVGKGGRCSPEKVFLELLKLRAKAGSYVLAEESWAAEAVKGVRMPKGRISTGKSNMREWLANLYTVTERFIHQYSERPNVKFKKTPNGDWEPIPCPFLALLSKWRDRMVATLKETGKTSQGTHKFKYGDRVYWTDPDGGLCSGPGTVSGDDGEIIAVDKDNGGFVGALREELTLL